MLLSQATRFVAAAGCRCTDVPHCRHVIALQGEVSSAVDPDRSQLIQATWISLLRLPGGERRTRQWRNRFLVSSKAANEALCGGKSVLGLAVRTCSH